MLDVPTDRDGYVDKGLLALRDFAGGASLTGEEIDKERGVVLEEWRGRLGASSRVTDQQLPILFAGSRYADRLPIGLPDTLRTFPHERLRAFYRTWYRADRMAVVVAGDLSLDEAERLVRQRFSDLPAPTAPAPDVPRVVPPHTDTLYKMVTDSEAQRWSVTAAFKSAPEPDGTAGACRRSIVRGLALSMLNQRLSELARRPDAPFLSADAGASGLGRGLSIFELSAEVPAGKTAHPGGSTPWCAGAPRSSSAHGARDRPREEIAARRLSRPSTNAATPRAVACERTRAALPAA
jgi:zinc protease